MPNEILSATSEFVQLRIPVDTPAYDVFWEITGTDLVVDHATASITQGVVTHLDVFVDGPQMPRTLFIELRGVTYDFADLAQRFPNTEPMQSFQTSITFALAIMAQNIPDSHSGITPLMFFSSGESSWQGRVLADALLGGADLVDVHLRAGDDYASLTAENAMLHGGIGDDVLRFDGGGFGTIQGGSGNDVLQGDLGQDWLWGGPGHDALRGGYDDDAGDRLFGGLGDDTLFGSGGGDLLLGGAGHDVLYPADAQTADLIMSGGAGRDAILVGRGNNVVQGGADSDVFVLQVRVSDPGGLAIWQYDQRTVLRDFDPTEDLLALRAFDKTPASAATQFEAFMAHSRQQGDDVIFNNAESILVIRDVALSDFTEAQFFVAYEGFEHDWALIDVVNAVSGTAADDTLDGGARDDRITGGAGHDRLSGGVGADTLLGGAGNDQLRGGHGDDLIGGGAGRDVLMGYRGDDTLAGGADGDMFVIFTAPDATVAAPPTDFEHSDHVTILDFDPAQDALLFIEGGNGGALADRHAQFHTHANQAGSHVVYNDGQTRVVLRNTELDELTPDVFRPNNLGFDSWFDVV